MVAVIGVVTVSGLIWVLASTLARESDAERRRASLPESRSLVANVAECQQKLPLAA
jgi:hypothetical protein